jgi:hypothetical protein
MAIATFPEISSRSKPFLGMAKLCPTSVGLPAAAGGKMFTDHSTRAIEAPRTSEFDHPSAAWSLADDIADRIAIAAPAELDGIVKDMWCDHTNGRLTDDEMETLDEAARARRETFQERRQTARPGPARRPGNVPAAFPRRPPRQRSPDRQASIERRRRMVGTIAMPPSLAAKFTWGEVAVLRVIGDEVKRHGACSLYIDAIAAMAGMHRTTVQNAIRQARRLGLITVEERRPPGRRKSLNNIVRIVSQEWLTWLRRGPRAWATVLGSGSNKKSSTTDTSPFLKKSKADGTPLGVPDGVYPCEKVG